MFPAAEAAPGLCTSPPTCLMLDHSMERITGPQARPTTQRRYRVWHKTDDVGGRPGKVRLVDDAPAPRSIWWTPASTAKFRSHARHGTDALKFTANTKAVLMSYIIKGILDRKLPWAMVLLGVMISIVLELGGIPSLAFAVGVYLPISSSAPLL